MGSKEEKASAWIKYCIFMTKSGLGGVVLLYRLVPQYERGGHKRSYQWGTTAVNDPMLYGYCHQHQGISQTQSGTEPMPPETRKVLDVRR